MKNIFIILTLLFSLHLVPSVENTTYLNDTNYKDQGPISNFFVALVYKIELTQTRNQVKLPHFLSLIFQDFTPKLRPSTLISEQEIPYRNYLTHCCELYICSGPAPPSFS